MAESALTVQAAVLAGLTPAYAAANADGNYFPNSGKEFLHIKNSGISTVVTIDSPAACNQGTQHDVAVTVPPTTGDKIIGPFPKERFNDGSGNCHLTYAQVTGITIAVITVSP